MTPDFGPLALDAGLTPDAATEPVDRTPVLQGPVVCDSTLGDACERDADCSDRCFCNGWERCLEGVCAASTDDVCDDGLACTADSCHEGDRRCIHAPRDSACDDGNECTGAELCDPVLGCVPGIPPSCGDGDPCTTDLCVPGEGCRSSPRDLDDDGFVVLFCGGSDCNDDPDGGSMVHPDAEELCADGIDNDCDGLVDLLDAEACPMTHDHCASALDLAGRPLVSFPRGRLADDFALSCGDAVGTPDAVFHFELAEQREVSLELRPSPGAVMEVRPSAGCDDEARVVACAALGSSERGLEFSYPGLGPLPAGSYDVIVELPSAGDYDLFFDTRAVEPRPDTDLCIGSAPIIDGTTVVRGTWAGHRDMYPSLGCGRGEPAAEVVHQLHLDDTSHVTIRADAFDDHGRSRTVRFALVERCTDPIDTALACTRNTSPRGRLDLDDLDAGAYWILLEHDGLPVPLDYELDVRVTPAP